ncbi:Thioredoxin domain-containing protein [Lamellibrachia satsuma]|nr:Thioredoxin domain-containing protein [Lamellibrachia satsuma]
MARRKQEAQLQVEIESTEEFEDMMNKEGLTVVDVYQEWCGPCRGMVSNLRKLKNELGDPLLHFAVAKADTIDSLENYRGKCEPCFLFFATGCLVSVIRGANSPLLVKTITEQLAYEHKVLEGSAERKEIKDEEASPPTEEEEEEGEGEGSLFETGISLKSGMRYHGEIVSFDTLPKAMKDGESSKMKGVTVAIIKPDVVADGKVDDIIEEMKKAGIEILEKQERQLTEEEAREFYDHKKDEAFFEDLIKFMTSGPSVALVLTKGETGEGIIEEWRELLGPPSVEEAKESAPDSLRARFGHETYVNAVHGSDSTDMATKELAFFFPTFAVPTIASKTKKKQIQRTLALIRPDALAAKKDDILEKIKEAGFSVAMQKEVRLSPEQAAEFYKEHEGQPYYEDLVNKMSGGPLLALALARDDAVQGWRDLLGPKEVGVAREEAPESFRAQFSAEEDVINPLHGSDNPEHAKQELDFFFPMQKTVAVIKPDAYENKDDIMNKIKEAGFNIAARKETELTKEIAEEFYKAQEESEYFQDLTQHMTSGKTLFMVLTKEDAVDGWRSMIGPTDPEEAKEAAPDTIRAQFGHNSLANAVHGSANQEEADKNISLIFGDLDVTPDGRVKGSSTSALSDGQSIERHGVRVHRNLRARPSRSKISRPSSDHNYLSGIIPNHQVDLSEDRCLQTIHVLCILKKVLKAGKDQLQDLLRIWDRGMDQVMNLSRKNQILRLKVTLMDQRQVPKKDLLWDRLRDLEKNRLVDQFQDQEMDLFGDQLQVLERGPRQDQFQIQERDLRMDQFKDQERDLFLHQRKDLWMVLSKDPGKDLLWDLFKDQRKDLRMDLFKDQKKDLWMGLLKDQRKDL